MVTRAVEKFNFVKLEEMIAEDTGLVIDTQILKDKDVPAIFDEVVSQLKKYYTDKFGEVEAKSEIERMVHLQILDEAWRNHLYQMDILKTGIGLRGYNQKDPLVEYKKESYSLFTELISLIKHNAVKLLHHLQISREERPQQHQDVNVSFVSKDTKPQVEQNQNSTAEQKKLSRREKYNQKKIK
jgi:preprotein translocase subunit SecA